MTSHHSASPPVIVPVVLPLATCKVPPNDLLAVAITPPAATARPELTALLRPPRRYPLLG